MSIQITSDIIRRFPFAVRPDRITEADEAWIAAEMAKTIKQEQRDNGEKPGGQPPGMYTHNVASQASNEMLQNQVVHLMRDGETRSIKQMATFLNAATYETRTACVCLTNVGTLERVTGNNRSNISLYRLPRCHDHKRASCACLFFTASKNAWEFHSKPLCGLPHVTI